MVSVIERREAPWLSAIGLSAKYCSSFIVTSSLSRVNVSSEHAPNSIRTYGDPVLTTVAATVENIDGKLVSLAEDMLHIMYEAPGIGLAGPQIGVQKQIFVWDLEDDPQVILNPVIVESSGEWVYDEGCLSIPGLFVEMLRPKLILVRGVSLDGNEVEFEADELLSRLFQHEIDHLQGVLMFDRMAPEQRKVAMKEYRQRVDGSVSAPPVHVKLD
jgi:peptide deformylase